MRISEIADTVGVPVSTVRYYERIGLMGAPSRTGSGYRDYDDDSAQRLLFVSRARRLGLRCDQIADLLPVWGGANCAPAQEQILRLISDKQAEIAAHIEELAALATQLAQVRTSLAGMPAPDACQTDLACCMPASDAAFVPAELVRHRGRHAGHAPAATAGASPTNGEQG